MKKLMDSHRLRLAVLASGRGSNFDAIYQAVQDGRLDADINVLISDQKDAPVLSKAENGGIDSFYIDPGNYNSKDDYEEAIVDCLKQHNIDLVVLAGYMRLLGNVLLTAYPWRIINIHPSLLPAFTGLHAQRQAVEYGVRYSGCTVHLVDAGMDTGPIIMQAVVPVLAEDDEDSLAARILAQEHQIYWQSLQLLAEGRVYIDGRRIVIKD